MAIRGAQASPNSEIKDTTLAEAVIQIGDVAADDHNALYKNVDKGVFTDYMVINRYERDLHVYMMPITSPNGFQGDQVAFVKLGAFTVLWIADWTAERVGEPPEIPSPIPADKNTVLLDEHQEPAMVELLPNGVTKLWRLSGTYVYGFKNPGIVKPVHGAPPWMEAGFSRYINQAGMQQGIINAAGGGGGASPGSAGGNKKDGKPGVSISKEDVWVAKR